MSQLNCSQLGSLSLPASLVEIAFMLRDEERRKGFRNVTITVTENQVNVSVAIPCTTTRTGGRLVLNVLDYIDIPTPP